MVDVEEIRQSPQMETTEEVVFRVVGGQVPGDYRLTVPIGVVSSETMAQAIRMAQYHEIVGCGLMIPGQATSIEYDEFGPVYEVTPVNRESDPPGKGRSIADGMADWQLQTVQRLIDKE